MSTKTLYCPCCGHDRPTSEYRPASHVCNFCIALTASDATILARETMGREIAISTQTKEGKKRARVAARLEHYARHGKRCSACHHYKPADAYNACAPQPDGLQPICRSCYTIRQATVKSGGLTQWHAVRDAMRANSPEGK
jgi:hypothetical protein